MRASSIFLGLFVALFSLAAVSAQSREAFINDMNTLNYALALENFEAELYRQFIATFPSASAAGVPQLFYTYLTDARTAEGAHADALRGVIRNAGWLPAPACTYDLNKSSVGALGTDPVKWLNLITVVEDTGAAAYTYASQLLTSSGYLQFAATVATVEARHAAFLNALVNASSDGVNLWGNRLGGEKGYNAALSVAEVVNVLVTNKFLVSCDNVTGNTFDGPKTFNVFDHTGNGPYVPKLANTFRKAAGTYLSAARPGVAFLNQAQYARDTLILQYALTAENAEDAFYKATLNPSAVSRDVFVNYFTAINPYQSANASLVYDFLLLIADHEASHASILKTVIDSRSATGHAVQPCVYNLTVDPFNLNATDPASFLATSKLLEDTGVQAYAGVITYLSDTNLVGVAASIALIEARHAAYLRSLLKETGLVAGSSQTTDQTLTPAQVAAVLGKAFVTCPTSPVADPNNPTLAAYSSATLPYASLNGTLGAAGFNDGAAYDTLGTNVKTSTSNPGRSTGSASGVVVSVAVTLAAVFAMLL